MESSFSTFTWAYMLKGNQDKYGRDAYKELEFYSKYHKWSEEFTNEIKAKLDKLNK